MVLSFINWNEAFWEAVYQHCTSRNGQLGKPFLPLKPRPWSLWCGYSLPTQLRDGVCDVGPRLSQHCLPLATGIGSGMEEGPNEKQSNCCLKFWNRFLHWSWVWKHVVWACSSCRTTTKGTGPTEWRQWQMAREIALDYVVPETVYPFTFLSFLKKFYFIYLSCVFSERGEERGKERERETSVGHPSYTPWLGTWPATQACALTRNQTGDLLFCKVTSNQLSHTGQGSLHFSIHEPINFLFA